MPIATTTVPKSDHETMLAIFRLLTKSHLDPKKVIAESLRLIQAGNCIIVVEIDHIVYDVNGDPVRKPDGQGFVTRPRTFHLPVGVEVTEEEAKP